MTAQLDMFGDTAQPGVSASADPERVRRKLDAMLEEARRGQVPQSRRRLMETVVPQMVRWLPEDEANQVRQAFGEALAA
jgi:L-fucose isomerase-like protein